MAGNRLSDLASIVEDLDATGRLVRVRSEVDPHLELAGVVARFEGGPRAVLFDNVFGHGLNPGFPDYLGTKIGFDACRPFPHTPEYDRAVYDSVDLGSHEIDVPAIRGSPGTER